MPERLSMRWGVALGIALGGFFDGILLHQILQWHHLFSLVPGVDTLRAQILWDGYFHALMYAVAVVALWGLWRRRHASRGMGGLPGTILVGFGLWHVLDAVVSHWVLGIHRIRIDAADPLLWDLAWFAGFGLVPLFLGLAWLRGKPRIGGLRSAPLSLGLAGLVTAAMAGWSLWPAPEARFATIVFAPGVSPAQAVGAIRDAEARLVWADPQLAVAVVEASPRQAISFYGRGALLVGAPGVPAGCASWGRA